MSERIEAGDVVRVVVGPQMGYMHSGTVVSVDETGAVLVHFPDGVSYPDDQGICKADLFYNESELEKMSL